MGSAHAIVCGWSTPAVAAAGWNLPRGRFLQQGVFARDSPCRVVALWLLTCEIDPESPLPPLAFYLEYLSTGLISHCGQIFLA